MWIAVALFPFVYVFTPAIYFGKKLRAQVIDSVTFRPVSKVQIKARWTVYRPTLNFESDFRQLHQAYAITDDDGFFEIPAWGPILEPRWYSLDSVGPELELQKVGYEDRGVSRPISYFDSRSNVWLWKNIGAEWSGCRIRLYGLEAPRQIEVGDSDPY